MRKLNVGDSVRLIAVPDWLVHDLPANERQEILACVGKTTVISEIDSHGYFWIGFGDNAEDEDGLLYSGHSFCVPIESIEPIDNLGKPCP